MKIIVLKGSYLHKLKVYIRLDDLKALEKSIRDFGQYRGMDVEWESYIGDDYNTYYKFIEDAIEVPSIHNIYEIMHNPTRMLDCINKYLDYRYDLTRYEPVQSLTNVLYFDKIGFTKIKYDETYYRLKLVSPTLTMEAKYWYYPHTWGWSRTNSPAVSWSNVLPTHVGVILAG